MTFSLMEQEEVYFVVCVSRQHLIKYNVTVLNVLFFAFLAAELHPAPDFSRHTLIKPRIYHGREKRQISTTKSEVY